jgi:AcrR family transcriptional regulator
MIKAITAPNSRRKQKRKETRARLLTAAAEQVSVHGYTGASVQRITTAADIANGTFYNYFKSQQDLFDQLLPEMGNYMLGTVRTAIEGEDDSIKREELGFRAFFDYLTKNPSFYRILNEAEYFAPSAYRDHMNNMIGGYNRALGMAKSKGELPGYSERELEAISCILLSARNYLSFRYCVQNGKVGRLPDWVTKAYMKFVINGVSYGGSEPQSREIEAQHLHLGDDYVVDEADEGGASVAMKVLDFHLDAQGFVDRGSIAGLVDRAAAEAARTPAYESARSTSLSVNYVRSSHARMLVATAARISVTENVAHVSVEVRENDMDGDLLASAVVVLMLE